jgi:predicted peptidase
MMKKWFACLLVVALYGGCISVRTGDIRVEEEEWDTATGFIHLSTEVNGVKRPGMVYVPADYDPDNEYPLIVFLHGLGESGDNGIAQTNAGLGNAIRKNPERFPCIVYFPQSPRNQWWSIVDGRETAPNSFEHITDGIERVLDRYSVDEDRVSLTGLSMGGYGAFAYGAAHADRFSAFMPICGGGDIEGAAGLARRPMRVFHGEADGVINVDESKKMVDATRALGGTVKLTTYPGVGHNSWDKAYSVDEKAIEWLLEQRRQ